MPVHLSWTSAIKETSIFQNILTYAKSHHAPALGTRDVAYEIQMGLGQGCSDSSEFSTTYRTLLLETPFMCRVVAETVKAAEQFDSSARKMPYFRKRGVGGHYEYRVMPYGLANAPAVFQSFINEIFRDILNKYVVAYIDDILIYSKSEEEHQGHVRTVLTRLLENQLYVKAEKCEFHVQRTSFLGYNVSYQGVEMDNSKITAVTEWPRPTTVKELQRFLGFAHFYRRFIRNYSITAAPLTSLLKGKPSRLKWTENATHAFTNLKNSFTTAPILKHPDPNLPFVVEVDASDSGIGAVLSQRHGQPGKLFPCAYFSRKLTNAERNYDVGNKELLAMKAAIEEWRHWLEGSTHPFQIIQVLGNDPVIIWIIKKHLEKRESFGTD
ncbi:hypothetical protein QTP70_010507 [Hemibagrus guttatus]|uniref:ribonuclease H n=1 Tax=Hemibagrus guttatus TaxID=175788 RepID=A0AAE0UWQ0_9TELE|nr:hypothetical protein QTP70_010507 [Hemibagrus guttatus]